MKPNPSPLAVPWSLNRLKHQVWYSPMHDDLVVGLGGWLRAKEYVLRSEEKVWLLAKPFHPKPDLVFIGWL